MRTLRIFFVLAFLTVGCGTTDERPDAQTPESGDPSQTAADSGDGTTVASTGTTSEPAQRLGLRTVTINAPNGEKVKVRVEIADTTLSRLFGSGVRERFPEDRGLLFVYELQLRTVTINAPNGEKVKVRVEIADTDLSRFIGLRGRESLPEDRGMLFVYDEEGQPSFTMEYTLIPLSIAFMYAEGRIVDIQDMQPLEEGPYVSAEPAQYALEVNQGFFEEHGVKVGDRANLPV